MIVLCVLIQVKLALIKILFKINHVKSPTPPPSPSLVPVLLFAHDLVSHKIMIIGNSILSFVKVEHIAIVA